MVEVFRAFPEWFEHPSKARRLSPQEFTTVKRSRMGGGKPVCPGHVGTAVWHCELGYIVEVKAQGKPAVYILSLCTFTPTFGIDLIDGMLIQDAEEFILLELLGRPTDRLDIYGKDGRVSPLDYLRARGIFKR